MSTQYQYASAWSTQTQEDKKEGKSGQNQKGSGHSDMQAGRKPKKAASAFRTISEVADALDVQQHVLRFWETKFSQVRPLKRGGGRRYYRPEDVTLLKTIHHLLYTEGYTIKGVQKLLREQGKNKVVQNNRPDVQSTVSAPKPEKAAQAQNADTKYKKALEVMLEELKSLRKMIEE